MKEDSKSKSRASRDRREKKETFSDNFRESEYGSHLPTSPVDVNKFIIKGPIKQPKFSGQGGSVKPSQVTNFNY